MTAGRAILLADVACIPVGLLLAVALTRLAARRNDARLAATR